MRIRIVLTIAGILLASSAWAQWNVQTVDNSGNTGQKTSIAYDAQGYPHIGYTDSNGAVYHSYWTGHAWQIERVGGSGWGFAPVALCIDDAGAIHMVYGTNHGSILAYRKKVDGVWQYPEENITSDVSSTSILGICTGPDGTPYVSFGTESKLACAHKPASTWIVDTVDEAQSVGSFSSIACDQSSHLFIAYSDDSGLDLKFAYYDGSVWSTQIVDMGGDVATYGVSLKLDGSGNPCIAYYDQTNGNLKYAKFTGTLGGKAGLGPVRHK